MRFLNGWALSITALLGAACSSATDDAVANGGSGGGGSQQYETLKIATWFAAPGELEALQEIINDYQEGYPGARVQIVPISIGPGPRNAQLHAGDDKVDAVEWDVAYQMQPFLGQMTDTAIDLSTIESLSGALAGTDPALQNTLQVGGMVPGLPVAIDRLNGLTYNLGLMTAPPSTLEEFRGVCTTYLDNGKIGPKPYVTGTRTASQDTRIYLISLLGLLPAEVLFGRDPAPAEKLGAALSALAYYRDSDCMAWASDDNVSGANWDEAAQDIIDDHVMMSLQPDWGNGYFVANGQKAGTDYATRTLLHDTGAYVYTAEFLIGRASSAKRAEIENFLGVAGRLSTQLSYAEVRGALPALAVTNPQAQISNPGTLAQRLDFDRTAADGRIGTMPGWVASATKPTNYLLPFMLGEMSLEDAVQGYLCGDAAPYPGYACP